MKRLNIELSDFIESLIDYSIDIQEDEEYIALSVIEKEQEKYQIVIKFLQEHLEKYGKTI